MDQIIRADGYEIAARALGIPLRPGRRRSPGLRNFTDEVVDMAAADDGSPEAMERMALVMLCGDGSRDEVAARDLLFWAFVRHHDGVPDKKRMLSHYIETRLRALRAEAAKLLSHELAMTPCPTIGL